MTVHKATRQLAVAVSISESPNMEVLGLSGVHLNEAMAEVARYGLNFGSRLVYGGGLRQHGFTKVLFELVARHQPSRDDADAHASVTNYLAWPVHISMPFEKIEEIVEDHSECAEPICWISMAVQLR